MAYDQLAVILIATAALAIAVFGLGYNAAEEHGRRAIRELGTRLRHEQMQKHQLSKWVRQNWPNEYEAWERGHREGYQQGILQASELERDEHDDA